MTGPVRESTHGAVHASRAGPLTAAAVVRTLVGAAVVGAFLAYGGAFGSANLPLLPRFATVIAMACIGALIGMASFRFAGRVGLFNIGLWRQALGGGLIMIAPMSLVIWAADSIAAGALLPASALPQLALTVSVICVAMTFLAVAFNRSVELMTMTSANAGGAPAKFLDRLPPKLRGAELYAVEAEDHYLRLHTSKGQDLILMRLADAIGELDGIEGAQAHRSWWVARAAIAEAKRGDGRATLTLKDGCEVPVSRTYARQLREAGWI